MAGNGQGFMQGGQCYSVQPSLLKPNRITEVEVTIIDAAKQVKPNMLLGYELKMKDALRLAHLHKTQCYLLPFVYPPFVFVNVTLLGLFLFAFVELLTLFCSWKIIF